MALPQADLGQQRPALLGVLLAGLTILGFGVAVFMQPLSTVSVQPRPFQQEFRFVNVTELPESIVYEHGELRLSDPVFFAVLDAVELEVEHRIVSRNATTDDGELGVAVVLESTAGWRRVLTRVEPVAFSGNGASAAVEVDFVAAQALADEVADAAGTGGNLTVRVVAEARLEGVEAADVTNAESIDPVARAELSYQVGDTAATVDRPRIEEPVEVLEGIVPGTAGASTRTGEASGETGGASGETGVTSGETGDTSGQTGLPDGVPRDDELPVVTPLRPQEGVVEVTQLVPTSVSVVNELSLLGVSVRIATMRTVAVVAGILWLVAVVWLVVTGRRRSTLSEAEVLSERFASQLVSARTAPTQDATHVVELAGFDGLHQLATALDIPIVRTSEAGQVSFVVMDGPTAYRYATEPVAVAADATDTDP